MTYVNPGGRPAYCRVPRQPRHPGTPPATPTHPRTVQAPETRLDQIVSVFFATRIFGPGHAALLATQLPATDADALADRDAQAAALQARIRRIETAQNSQILELEDLPADPADTAAAAMRARIRARFTDLHRERERLETQLAALAKTTPAVADPALLDELPVLGDILPGLPPALKARLFAAFDLEILWNKPGQPGHRVHRDHREHPPGHPRHHRPRPERLPRHQHQPRRHRPAHPHVGSDQHP